ncbi:YugN-like family protein [Halobacillus sp. A1]|uniref:YugN family protein n=1 Tax=Halobacillus sp. A1 TaxID=2880262 RepID=UPI0020A67B27|nr:YugN family protein [Halobacillus sp. A1]MCP3032765.1 YugN-like family protein [Halobacillus sp. A1]
MITLESELTNKLFVFHEMEQALQPLGFKLADNWEYDHGYLDYKIDNEASGYQFLRLPVEVIEGQFLDNPSDATLVKVKEPYLLAHYYQDGIDDHVREGNFRASFDQFQEPKDKDGEFPEHLIPVGMQALLDAEQALRAQRNEQN